MAFKDKEKEIAYGKKYYKENRAERLAYCKRYKEERRREALRLLGGRCFFCGKIKKIRFHKKDGKRHISDACLLVLKNPGKFVLLCVGCHVGVHFCMRWLSMDWDEIVIKILK